MCGIVAPVLVVLLIVVISKLGAWFGGGFGAIFGVTMEIEELIVIAGVPMVLGLVWNRWAGGAAGFLMGSLYALFWAIVTMVLASRVRFYWHTYSVQC